MIMMIVSHFWYTFYKVFLNYQHWQSEFHECTKLPTLALMEFFLIGQNFIEFRESDKSLKHEL